MATPAVTPTPGKVIHPSWFARAGTFFIKIGTTIKNGIIGVASKIPAIEAELTKAAPTVEALSNLFVPGSGNFEAHLLDVWSQVASAVKAAGDAAGANGISVSFDQKLVAEVKAILPAVEKFLHPSAGPTAAGVSVTAVTAAPVKTPSQMTT